MIDAHCHLYEIEEGGWMDNGLEAMICCGSGTKNSQESVELARKYANVYATVGVHPENISDRDEGKLLELAKDKKVVAIGECGLDSESEAEVELFKFNIGLAQKTGLPLVVHCRGMFEKVFEILDYDRAQMHCFTGNMAQMEECVRRGWYISLGGILTFKKSEYLREVAKIVPEDRLLTETDAPYLAPEPVRGSRNIPGNVKYVVDCLAGLRGKSVEYMDQVTSENARRLFNI